MAKNKKQKAPIAQSAPVVTKRIALERLNFVITTNRTTADVCERVFNHIKQHPEIEADMVKVFGIQPVSP